MKRIKNAYTQCGRIANPAKRVANPAKRGYLLFHHPSGLVNVVVAAKTISIHSC